MTAFRLRGLSRTVAYVNRVLALGPVAGWALQDTAKPTMAAAVGTAVGRTTVDSAGGASQNTTLGVAGPFGDRAVNFTGAAAPQYISIGSAALDAVFDGNTGSMIAWGRYTGDWASTGDLVPATGYLIHLRYATDGTYYMVIGRSHPTAGNTVQFRRRAGNLIGEVSYTTDAPTGWFMMGFTWDTAAGQLKAYYNGQQIGLTVTDKGLDTWGAASVSDEGTNVLGSGSLADQPWVGDVAHCYLWDRVLTPAEMEYLSPGYAPPPPPDPPVFRSAAANANTGSATTLVVNLPAGVTDGDYLLMGVSTLGVTGATTCPAGWSTVVADFISGGNANHLAVFGKVAASEPATVTVTCPNGRHAGAVIAIQPPFNATTPVDVSGTATASGASVTAPSVNAAAATLLVTFHAGTTVAAATAHPWTGPAGMTQGADACSTYGGTNSGILVSHKALAASGATGTQAATQNSTGSCHAVSVVVAAG